jgi:DNA-directed RNA polymerase specialized sigma24 family protein
MPERLPDRLRELLVLRDLEGLSYRELADDLPIGTTSIHALMKDIDTILERV